MSNHDEGLIGQYVQQVQALGVRAEAGEDVKTDVEAVVIKACEHFRATGDPQANLPAFKGRLRITAEVAHSSQLAFKQTLMYAASVCPAEI